MSDVLNIFIKAGIVVVSLVGVWVCVLLAL